MNDKNLTQQLIDSEKRAIAAMLRDTNDIDVIHKVWSTLNRYTVKKARTAKEGASA